jgi:hypothetical protein
MLDALAPYRRAQPSPTGRSRAHGLVAISAAAHAALVDLFPAQQPSLFDPLLVALGAGEDSLQATKRRAAADGRAACAAVLDARHHDGANQLGDLNGVAPYSDYTAWALFRHLCTKADCRGNLIQDAHRAATALEHNCTYVTTDAHYARFPGLRWRHPLD